MSERFFSSEPITGTVATLHQQEAHHLLHVMRLKAGAQVTLFDGLGAEFQAEVSRCGRTEVELAVLARHEIDRELPASLVIVSALPKGDRQRWMIEKLTELGVTRLLLIQTQRSIAKLAGGMAKLERAVIEASKQCRRNRLMRIENMQPWPQALAERSLPAVRWIAHPSESDTADSVDSSATERLAEGTAFAIGPEGGFTDDEIAGALAGGWLPIDLGPRILRTETAAVAAAVRGADILGAGGDVRPRDR